MSFLWPGGNFCQANSVRKYDSDVCVMNMTGESETRSGGSIPHLGDDLLSAYLDSENSAEERMLVERHLPACVECSTRLNGLRTVVAALKALPVAPVPRSFAIPATTAKPALSWFYRLRLASAVTSFVFIALLVFNIAYISVPLGEVTLKAEYPASISTMVPQSIQSGADAAKSAGLGERAAVERAAAPAASASATGAAEPEREMASTVFEVKVVPTPSPLAGYEWYLLTVAVALGLSTYGLWLAKLRQ